MKAEKLIAAHVSPKVHGQVAAVAAARGISVSSLVSEVIEDLLEGTIPGFVARDLRSGSRSERVCHAKDVSTNLLDRKRSRMYRDLKVCKVAAGHPSHLDEQVGPQGARGDRSARICRD